MKLSLFLGVGLLGCDESDPTPISLRSAESRLAGEWQLQDYYLKNELATDSLADQFRLGRYQFLKPEDEQNQHNLEIFRTQEHQQIEYQGFWAFPETTDDSLILYLSRKIIRYRDASGEMLVAENSPYTDTTTLINAQPTVWGIDKLKNDRLVLLLWEKRLELKTF